MTIAQAIQEAETRLRKSGVPDPRFDAELLMRHSLGRDRAWLLAHLREEFPEPVMRRFQYLIARRSRREPAQYLIGTQEFWGLEFVVTPDVLIPRPETELVVEEALKALQGAKAPLVIDLCTGSGCIAAAVAHGAPGARVFGTDRSDKALALARENARRIGVSDLIRFLEGDLFGPLAELNLKGRVDAITANPPYISSGDMAGLQPEVRDFEPALALDAGPRGTEIAVRIIADAPAFLKPGGVLAMEMGMGQGPALREAATRTEAYDSLSVLPDLAGIERVIVAKKQ